MSAPNKEGPFGFHLKLNRDRTRTQQMLVPIQGALVRSHSESLGRPIPMRDHQETAACGGGTWGGGPVMAKFDHLDKGVSTRSLHYKGKFFLL